MPPDTKKGCEGCLDGRVPCDPLRGDCQLTQEMDAMFPSNAAKQARESQDQEPFTAPASAQEFAELGMFAVPLPKTKAIPVRMAYPEPNTRRYNAEGVYCSPAEEEMIRLSRLEEVVIENVLHAERTGEITESEAHEVLASAGSHPGTLKPNDMVNLPQHYARFKIEPIRFIVENGLNWFQGNIVKYAARAEHKHKTPVEDISKIIRYGEMWREFAKGNPDWWR